MITESEVSLLHSCYQKMTGFNIPMRSLCDTRRLGWQKFLAEGHTLAELESVIIYLKHEIREQRRNIGALRFSNLILDLDRFQEEAELASGWKRNYKPAPTARERVVEQWSPRLAESPVKDSFVHISIVLEAMRKAAQ